jgi:hypothetical protein
MLIISGQRPRIVGSNSCLINCASAAADLEKS